MARGRAREMVAIWALLVGILVGNPGSVSGTTDQNDVSTLNAIYVSLNSPPVLTNWVANGGDPCGQSWMGIECTGSAVMAIKLPNLGLSGMFGYNLETMTSLKTLDISNNNIGSGSQIPYNLPPNLQILNFGSNQFSGIVPYSISKMVALKNLNLAHNQLQGNLTDVFGGLGNLTTMDLSFNQITGDLPVSFSNLSSLTTLDLEDNQFTGHIDVLANLPLQHLNVGNNHFTGWIPDQLKKINSLQTDGNSWSSTPAPPPPPYHPPPPSRKSNPGQHSTGSNNSLGSGGGNNSGISAGAIAGIAASVLVITGILAFFLIRRKSHKPSMEQFPKNDQSLAPLTSDDAKEMKKIQVSSTSETRTLPPPAPLNLKPPPIDRHKSFDEDDLSDKPVAKKVNIAPIKAAVYSVADLQIATDSFNIYNLVGEGSFGRVFKAQFSDGKVLAVKKINSSALPNQSSDDFIELVSNISRLHHPNLTELVGYCSEHGQHLLVYEFYKNGSLHDLLHLSYENSKSLSWNARVKVALGTARGLEYMHEVCSPSLVHKNFKSANILLDVELNPHLSDCGFESLVPDSEFQASEQNMASGYNPPEVSMSGQYTLKSDVYNFGVVMLELLTGRKAFDSSRTRSEQSLVRWATPQLHDIDALDRMVDPGLKGLYPAKSLSRFADVIALCVQPEPEFRPPMSEVVQALVRLVQRANMSKRMDEPEDYV
ncbi:protein STRUBBELIG-RECEPTOR FAMILY 6-like [Zingiber officinale]|uniref:protein STRUBBELIG-RECEPTOR FAMILY 6-like n=1 Tax=Zingiber officinale TaxID=94328 RepID=UPI001C4CC43E|nr:protein STRUBBELIG-RECEPTOR FAMILY 6-like [Zingiber officinale]XP_042391156.1 protein STRUBBELIG-RECEPTOR FAMILY 6-like [Zingiber officinale]